MNTRRSIWQAYEQMLDREERAMIGLIGAPVHVVVPATFKHGLIRREMIKFAKRAMGII